VNVVALEIFLEDYHIAIRNGGVDEVVDEQIQAHAGRHAKHGGQPQRNCVRAVQQFQFGLDFCLPVE
jgi:hypothetical protein